MGTERTLCKFIQRQLLVLCLYLSFFFMSYINMYRAGKMPGSWFTVALIVLLINLLVVMPFVIFLGFSLANIINADAKALKEIGRLKQEGESALVYFKHIIVTELTASVSETTLTLPAMEPSSPPAPWSPLWARLSALVAGAARPSPQPPTPSISPESSSQEEKIEEMFKTWAGSDDKITDKEILKQITSWSYAHGHKEFHIDRPKLLAMMRLVDDDRNGSINKQEFRHFALSCMKEVDGRQVEASEEASDKKEENVPDEQRSASAESLYLAHQIRETLEGQTPAELRNLAKFLQGLLRDTTAAAGDGTTAAAGDGNTALL